MPALSFRAMWRAPHPVGHAWTRTPYRQLRMLCATSEPELHITSSGCCGPHLDLNTCQRECHKEYQTAFSMSWIESQKECHNRCQIEPQNRCQIECQIGCQKEYQNRCQIESQNRCQIESQNRFQIECQKECQIIYACVYIYIMPENIIIQRKILQEINRDIYIFA